MRKYRVAVIGLGRISSTIDDEVSGKLASVMLPYSHTAAYVEVPRVEVVAGADPLPEKRADFSARWSVPAVYADYREMLAAEQPDLVSVCTRTVDRPEVVIACAEAGVKAIYAEKPMSFSLAEADTMVETCRQRGVKLAVGCTRRWDPWQQRARELVAEGVCGQPLNVSGLLSCQLSHNGSHLIDIVRYHAGNAPVEWVFGDMANDEAAAGDGDLAGNGYLHFANGVAGWIRSLPCGNLGGVELDILCANGRIRSLGNGIDWELWLPSGGDDRVSGYARRPFPRPQRLPAPTVNAINDILDAIEQDRDPLCSGEDGRAALEIAVALRQSHRERARIELPLADRSLRLEAHA